MKLLGFAALMLILVPVKRQSPIYKATLVAKVVNGHLEIVGNFYHNAGETMLLEYEMQVAKTGGAGTSKNVQAGRFTAQDQETAVLSKSVVNVNPKDKISIKLYIKQNQELIAQDSVQLAF